jgi:hypothetical protein
VATDPTTNQLRGDGWRPRAGVRYACGCRPGPLLCIVHRTIKTVEEHHPDGARARPTAAVSHAWTCPEERCGRTYWPPKEWEPELWPPILDNIRSWHSLRHAQDRITDADAGGAHGRPR